MTIPYPLPPEAESLHAEWLKAQQQALDAWDNYDEFREKAQAAERRLRKMLRKIMNESDTSEI